jgi:hypothetical protein
MRARWTAFSLAAAALLGPGRALADEWVFVHIESPVPARMAEYHAWNRRFVSKRPVCDSPCDARIYLSGDQRYAFTGGFPESIFGPSKQLTSDVTITVQPGSYGRAKAGLGAALGGGLSVAPGVRMVTFGSLVGQSALRGAGIGVMVSGGVAAITGAVLLATAPTKIKIQKTGAGPVGRAAPVQPRYWMGEF